MIADIALDDVIKNAVSVIASQAVGAPKINETEFMQPFLYAALTDMGLTTEREKKGLHFKHCQGPSEIRLGGIDIAVHRDDGSGYRAFLELKWGNPDWMILDFYKMTIARLSPGADSCYLVAGQPLTHWAKTDSVCELFRTERWRTENVLRRHYEAFRGDGKEYGKFTRLPSHIRTTLVADETLPAPLDKWAIKAIRVEPDPLDDTDWLHIKNGEIVWAA